MTLYEKWISTGYDKEGRSIKRVWDAYMPLEQKIYERMLSEKDPHIKGTVAELAEHFNMSCEQIVGFLDGIKDAADDGTKLPDLEEADEKTKIELTVDFTRLYKKMVEYKAEHLYGLSEWDNVFTKEERKEMYNEQKMSGTVVREDKKIGRNEPCPCGSGKKYKQCCLQ